MEPTVSSATVRAIAAYASARALPIEVPTEDRRYEFSEVEELWSRASVEARDPLIGSRAAALVPFGAFGAIEHLMMLSATLEEALHRLVRHYPTVNESLGLTLSKQRDSLVLELHGAMERRIQPAYAQFVLASIERRIEFALGSPGGRDISRVQRPVHALVIAQTSSRTRLPYGDAELCDAVERALLHRRPVRRTADLASEAIAARLPGGEPSLTDIARDLGTGARTLQRRLVLEGTCFRKVIDDVRRELAIRLLARDGATKAIADRLGFAEVRSFHRAFRRWTSTTPGAFKP